MKLGIKRSIILIQCPFKQATDLIFHLFLGQYSQRYWQNFTSGRMYDQPRTEETHASVKKLFSDERGVERSFRSSRVGRFFNAVKTGNIETVTLFLNNLPECIGWLDNVSH